ncbi:hypothetical protein Enr13x_20030 [Stieleria neptunia]|uniref:Uncharacterized protein n=1 Tax=Stieleria neptunia TaxID=2527979 RepID=A0A518HMV9_9BACT|nr:hypothetical protein Enr13x_20030 [Stieleria neptunia]
MGEGFSHLVRLVPDREQESAKELETKPDRAPATQFEFSWA